VEAISAVYLSARYNITTGAFFNLGGTSTFEDNVAAILGIPLY